MKNRFYDAEMHGADWNAAKSTYESLLNYLVDEEELHTVMMMMIGQLNASHTGVSGGPSDTTVLAGADASSRLRRSCPIRPASTASATSTRRDRPITTT